MNKNLQSWLASGSSRQYLQSEFVSVRKISSNLCGQMGIQLTLSQYSDYLAELNVIEKYHTSPVIITGSGFRPDSYVSLEELPFDSNQFAIVLVPCLSLFAEDIHSALREVYRITAPEGIVLITGINPISLIGLQAKLLPGKYPFMPAIGLNQMKSWLSLLGYEIVAGDLFQYSFLTEKTVQNDDAFSQKIEKIGNRWLPIFSGGYTLLAKKRVFSSRLNKIKKVQGVKSGKIAGSLVNKL